MLEITIDNDGNVVYLRGSSKAKDINEKGLIKASLIEDEVTK
jgi:hypothetical protein